MWKSFSDLFNKTPGEIKPLPWQDVVLTKYSPLRDIANVKTNVKLWTHQKAMLERCKYIEDHPYYCRTKTMHTERYMNKAKITNAGNVPIGILNDKPGTGKTFVLLALIALDTIPTLNIIVAPKNLISQWKQAIDEMFPSDSNFAWTTCDYESITKLYIDQRAFEGYRILLIDETFIDTFALSFESKVHRLIIDEVDNIQGRMTQHIPCDKLWFLSASFSPYDNDKYELPYEIDKGFIGNIICRCDADFIQESLQLKDPTTELIACDDADLGLFSNIVSSEIIKSLHACNNRPLKKYIEYMSSEELSYRALVEWYMYELQRKLASYNEDLVILEKQIKTAHGNSADSFRDTYRKVYDKKLMTEKWIETIVLNIKNYKEPLIEDTKIYKLNNDIIDRIRSNSNSKWLIFNDDIEALFILENELNKNKIPNTLLDGGSVETVTKALNAYKTNIQVLLVNSAFEACGLNLEMADNLLFMQATKPDLIEQVIGRAQRYGRKTILHIICLFNKMETIVIDH